jgi:hypothetical protein
MPMVTRLLFFFFSVDQVSFLMLSSYQRAEDRNYQKKRYQISKTGALVRKRLARRLLLCYVARFFIFGLVVVP